MRKFQHRVYNKIYIGNRLKIERKNSKCKDIAQFQLSDFTIINILSLHYNYWKIKIAPRLLFISM